MRILIKSAWGSDDPTKAAFPLLHANAFAEAGHEAQIFLLGEAVSPDAHASGECGGAGWMAATSRGLEPNDCAEGPDSRLNRVLTGPWGPGHGSRREECDVCEPVDACGPGRVG